MKTFLFNLGVALLFTHELDAVARQEWQLLFVLRDLDSNAASWWFIYLHLPLFLLVLYLGNGIEGKARDLIRLALAAFLPVHAVLHYSLNDAPAYDFHHPASQLLIFGAGIAGLAYVASALRPSAGGS